MSTLSELIDEIADQLNRTDIDDQITAAIQRSITFYKHKTFWINEERSSAVTTAGQEYYPVPSDFLAPIAFSIQQSSGRNHALKQRNAIWFHENADTNSTALPNYFSIIDKQIRLLPIPDSSYTMILQYYKQIPNPVETSEETDWTQGLFEQAILYRTKKDVVINYLNDLPLFDYYNGLELETLKQIRDVTTGFIMSGELEPDGDLSVPSKS